jgi:penicillin-binding protein 2
MRLSDFYKAFGSKKLRNAETADDADGRQKNRNGSLGEKNGKVFILLVAIFASFGVYAFKLFSMQVLDYDGAITEGQINRNRTTEIPAQRGEIYDRNMAPLVGNIDSFAVDITPGIIPADKYDSVVSRLSGYLSMAKRDIDAKIPSGSRRLLSAIEIKSNVGFSVIQNIAENIVDLPGVSWRSKPTRNYIETGSFSHIIGYVGNITNDELKILYNEGYKSTSILGKTGIEKQYDLFLQGKQGTESRTVDARGKLVTVNVDARGRLVPVAPDVIPPESGKNLVLTIDARIQKLAEAALGERVGAAVVLKPASGEIVALVSYPYFDANAMSGEGASSEYAKLASDAAKPLLNRAVNAAYPPASTFKVVMTTALLNEGVFSENRRIECTGNIEYGNRKFNCHLKSGHGWLDLRNGLAQSCDVYFWTVGQGLDPAYRGLGVDRIAQYSREFGLGQRLALDLPGTSDGFVPTAGWKERRYQEKWLGGDTMNMSIGQGYTLATPLHIANMMAMVANGGVIYTPHLLKEVRDPVSGDVISETKPEPLFESSIPADVWKKVQENLRYTVTNGTAQFPLHNRVTTIAGKTGTAEVAGYANQWHSWFVAYAPFDAPAEDAYVVCVLVEAVNPWEWWAPYASNIIFQGIFANQTFEEAESALGFARMARPAIRRE